MKPAFRLIRRPHSAESIIRNIYKAKELGYVIEVYFVGLDSPELAKKRVAHRVRSGGHGIPDEDIERRFFESLDNLKTIYPSVTMPNYMIIQIDSVRLQHLNMENVLT